MELSKSSAPVTLSLVGMMIAGCGTAREGEMASQIAPQSSVSSNADPLLSSPLPQIPFRDDPIQPQTIVLIDKVENLSEPVKSWAQAVLKRDIILEMRYEKEILGSESPVISDLVSLLDHNDPYFRQCVVSILRNLGPAAGDAIPTLLRFRLSISDAQATYAVENMGIGVVPALIDAIRSEEALEAKDRAAQMLTILVRKHSSELPLSEIIPVYIDLYELGETHAGDHYGEYLRLSACKGLGACGSEFAAQSEPILLRAINVDPTYYFQVNLSNPLSNENPRSEIPYSASFALCSLGLGNKHAEEIRRAFRNFASESQMGVITDMLAEYHPQPQTPSRDND